MKTPFFFLSWARVCPLLLAFTFLYVPNAQCELPFKHTLSRIKQRVGYALQKIGKEIDQSPSSPRNIRTEPINEPVYVYPPMLDQQTEPQFDPRQPASNVYGANNIASEPSAPSYLGSPTIVLRNSRETATGLIIPVMYEQQTQSDAINRPALRDIDMDPALRSQQASLTNTSTQGTPNDKKASTAPSPHEEIRYARTIPGHPGFVYPPGVTAEKKNMLDVRGCASGEKMRDPRTGMTFFVP